MSVPDIVFFLILLHVLLLSSLFSKHFVPTHFLQNLDQIEIDKILKKTTLMVSIR